MDLLPEPSKVFNPSALQRDVVHEQDDEQEQEDAEEARAIAEGIDNQLKELDDLDLDEVDDEEEDEYQQHGIPTVPIPGGIGVDPLQQQFKDKMFLADHHQGQQGNNDMLQILYDARGHQIAKLQKELSLAEAGQNAELRTLRHQLALVQGEKENLTARVDHLTDVADGQVEDNRKLRDAVDGLERKLELALRAKEDAVSQLESSDLMVKTLQSQLMELQKSDTVLRARHHHEEAVRSLRERHEMEVFRFNQEIESGKLKLKNKDNEIDALRNQLTKSERERDNLIVEKSEIVRGLQERLDASQKRLAQSIAEVGSQGYNNVKVMHQRYQQDQEKYANDVLAFTNEIQTLEGRLQAAESQAASLEGRLKAKEVEAADASQKLTDVTEKYSDLKRRARQYKSHCQTKQDRMTAQLKANEDEYRQRLLALKAKMDARDEQIEAELKEMASDFKEELAKAMRLAPEDTAAVPADENISPNNDFLISESSERRPAPVQVHPPPLQQMFESAKRNVRYELKRPSDHLA